MFANEHTAYRHHDHIAIICALPSLLNIQMLWVQRCCKIHPRADGRKGKQPGFVTSKNTRGGWMMELWFLRLFVNLLKFQARCHRTKEIIIKWLHFKKLVFQIIKQFQLPPGARGLNSAKRAIFAFPLRQTLCTFSLLQ